MKRRIVLVALPWSRDQDPEMPLGHATLLAALKGEPTLDVRSVVQAVNRSDYPVVRIVDDILNQTEGVEDHCVDLALGAYVWNEPVLTELLGLLRSRGFSGRIVLGGPQISYAGPLLESLYPNADVFIRGHAEGALLALAKDCGRPYIRGVHYAGEPDRCEQAEADTHTAPSPWLSRTIPVAEQLLVRWETQRGCQFKCSFCQHGQPKGTAPCGTLPDRRIFGEIELFCRSGIKRIGVLDPVFNGNSPHATRVLKEFASRGFSGELSLQCRPELVDKAFLDVAQDLNVCLEFGLQSIHAREYLAIGRRNSMRRVDQVLSEVTRRNIRHEVSLIYGLPEQTLDSFQASVRWCQERRVPIIKAFPLLLLRGTSLEQQREQFGLVVRNKTGPMVVKSNTFAYHDWKEMGRIAERLSRTEGEDHIRTNAPHHLATGPKLHAADWCKLAVGESK
jgi:radical SAM superfamily enzyme YgiQ (UPF0313 family)